jgi:hypothetical protein
MAESGPGKIRLFNDVCGPEIPGANAVSYGTSAGGCNYYLGDFALRGDLAETDSGAVALGEASGVIQLNGNNENGKGVALTTDLNFQPNVNGPIVVEARVKSEAALTARSIFIGLCGTIADDIAEPLTSVTVTHTLTAADLAGFVLDSQLTATADWHACYNGGTTTGQTVSTSTVTSRTAVAGDYDVLRLVVETNGTARYTINGVDESTVAGAVDPTVLQGVICGIWGTTTTAALLDVDYLLVEANRDWTV